MALLGEVKRRVRHVLGPLMGVLLAGYFSYHAIEGDRGVRAYQKLDREITDLTAKRDALVAERRAIEKRVAMLSPVSLDRDLLEERARIVLGYVPSDSLVVGPGILPNTHLAGLDAVR